MEAEQGEVLHQGWLTKSPPLETRKQLFNQSLITPKWRRRWFVLRQGAMPAQFLLHYYTDPQARKLKGVIDLDQCEQVDTGLTYQSGRVSYQFMFDIKTPKRVYYLAADSEPDMTAWVDWVCQVCGLRTFTAEEDHMSSLEAARDPRPGSLTVAGRLPSLEPEPVLSQPAPGPAASPYMHLSDCFTGGAPGPRPPGGPTLSRHSPDYQNSPADLPDSSLTCGDDSVFLPPSPAPALSGLSLGPAPAHPYSPGRPPKPSGLRCSSAGESLAEGPEDSALLGLQDAGKDGETNNNNSAALAGHPPPSVDRRLKPAGAPASLTLGPPVQRHRKPLSESGPGTWSGPRGLGPRGQGVPAGMVLPGNSESDEGSNSPDGSRRNSVDEQIYFYMPSLQQQDGTFMIPCDPVLDHCVQYLDLDLSAPASSSSSAPKKESEDAGTVYKTVDFIKTEAFNRTRQKVEEYKYNIKPETK